MARLRRELDDVRRALADSNETLRAIQSGEVDALFLPAVPGDGRVFTLATADRPYRNFVENMPDGAATVSAAGFVLYANQSLADLLETPSRKVVGQSVLDLVGPLSRPDLSEVLRDSRGVGPLEATLRTGSGGSLPVRIASSSLDVDGAKITCLTVTDLTSEHHAEAALTHSATHDALTSLPNRTLLTDRITHALARRSRQRTLMALLFCDVDGFKNVNDAHGHQVGDEVLRTVAARLMATVRPEDTVARIGGDEFVVLCETLADAGDATWFAERVRAAVDVPILLGSTKVDVSISIGVAMAALDEAVSPDTLLRDADEAMYKAKRQGPNIIELFDEQLKVHAATRLTLLTDLRHAVPNDELRLVYQPVITLDDQGVIGAEALVRWQHPERGLIPPPPPTSSSLSQSAAASSSASARG